VEQPAPANNVPAMAQRATALRADFLLEVLRRVSCMYRLSPDSWLCTRRDQSIMGFFQSMAGSNAEAFNEGTQLLSRTAGE
jgi:hypothetical protein